MSAEKCIVYSEDDAVSISNPGPHAPHWIRSDIAFQRANESSKVIGFVVQLFSKASNGELINNYSN